MDELMITLGKLKDESIESVSNELELDWDSKEAIKQVDCLYEIFGKPNYINIKEGGSVRWFDIEEPMSFSEVKVEDIHPYSLLCGKKNYSSFTIILRLSRNSIKKAPCDMVSYNHNQGHLTCYAETWAEAVVIASAVHMYDMKMIDSIEEMWMQWKDIEDPTPFVNFLLGDNNIISSSEDEEEEEEEEDEEEEEEEEEENEKDEEDEEDDEDKSPKKKRIIKTVDKNKINEILEKEPKSIILKNNITPDNDEKKLTPPIIDKKLTSPIIDKKLTPMAKTPNISNIIERKKVIENTTTNKKSIKSPIGKPVNGNGQNKIIRACSPPKSPIKTIFGSNVNLKSRNDQMKKNNNIKIPSNLAAVLGKSKI